MIKRAIVALLIGVLFPLTAHALPPEEVFSKAAPSVVMVLVEKGKTAVQGSGVVVGYERVITNCHVVLSQNGEPIEKIVIKYQQTILPAYLVSSDTDYDSCLLKVPGLMAPTVQIADTADIRIGQRVFAIGNPSGLDLTLTDGLVSGLRINNGSRVIQTSASISPGSSGGGLFNEDAKLVGITSFQIGTGTALNFAYFPDSVSRLLLLAKELESRGKSETTDNSVGALEQREKIPHRSILAQEEEKKWLAYMSNILKKSIQNSEIRDAFLDTLYYESTRAGLTPEMVLGLISEVSNFQKYLVTKKGAQGYMQVHPKWIQLIGSKKTDLFDTRTNLRFGCTILRHYIDLEKGDLYRALNRYNKSMEGRVDWIWIDSDSGPMFPTMVVGAWRNKFTYKH